MRVKNKQVLALLLGLPLVLNFATILVGPQIAHAAPYDITEYTVTGTPRHSTITTGPDGNLWFTELDTDQIGRIDPYTGVITEYLVPGGLGSWYSTITTGPDGNLWFTEYDASQIGRIDPDTGVITEYPTPTPNSAPYEIVTGPDGNLWFTEYYGNQIGRIDPDTGVITEYPIPTPDSGAWGIVTGPDGNLWFTEYYGNQIGRIDPDTGVITEYPSAESYPTAIAVDPSGYIWYSDWNNGDNLYRLDIDTLDTTTYPLGGGGGRAYVIAGLAFDSEGYLWFPSQNEDSIFRLSPDNGGLMGYPVPTAGSAPISTTLGLDGNIWFTSSGEALVGRLELPEPVVDDPDSPNSTPPPPADDGEGLAESGNPIVMGSLAVIALAIPATLLVRRRFAYSTRQ